MIRRDMYINKLKEFKDTDFIKIIAGIHRCGKTTILKSFISELISEGIPKENIIYISFEDMKYMDITNCRELNEIVISLTKNLNGKIYLLFDEIQYVEDWHKCINAFRVSLDADIYVTGSNSKILTDDLSTLITGRYISMIVYPFSFKEFLEYHKFNKTNLSEKEDSKIFEDYLKFGGMPGLLQVEGEDPKKAILTDTYNSIVYKDIIDKYNLRKTDILERFLLYLIDVPAETFSANSISNYFNNIKRKVSPDTLLRYIKCFKNTYFLSTSKRYDIHGKKTLDIYEKYYLMDHGFHHALIGDNFKIITKILENIVYIELLRRGYDVKIGKVKNKEVDFICRKHGEYVYIQVAYYLIEESTIEREFSSLSLIQDNYDKYVLSMDEYDFSRNGIKHRNIIEFLKSDYI